MTDDSPVPRIPDVAGTFAAAVIASAAKRSRETCGALVAAAVLTGCAAPASEPGSWRIERFPVQGDVALPFSEAVQIGDLLFLSGQIGTPGTRFEADKIADIRLVPGGIEAETRQTMENIREILERHGSSLDQIVKCTMMLEDMADWQTASAVYAGFFEGRALPARSALGADGLALGARVEIECVAKAGG